MTNFGKNCCQPICSRYSMLDFFSSALCCMSLKNSLCTYTCDTHTHAHTHARTHTTWLTNLGWNDLKWPSKSQPQWYNTYDFFLVLNWTGTTCLSTSHLRCHSRLSDNDSRRFCFPVPTKTLSYDSCVTITIHHYCLHTCGPCNN